MNERSVRGDRAFVLYMLAPAFFFLIAFYLYPTLFNLQNSFTDLNLFRLRKGGEWVGISNYLELLSSREFGRVLYNTTVWLTIVGVSVRIVLGLLLAFLINSATRPKSRRAIVAVVIWRWILDPQVGVVNEILLSTGLVAEPIAFLSEIDLVWPALITIITWNTLPLVTLTFLASLKSLPVELLEAAAVDGASKLQAARHIIIPHMMPAIIVMTLMSTFWTFNNFVYVWLTTGAGPGTFTNVMATEVYIKAFVDGRMGYSSAVGIVMAALMTLFGIIYLRFVARERLVSEG